MKKSYIITGIIVLTLIVGYFLISKDKEPIVDISDTEDTTAIVSTEFDEDDLNINYGDAIKVTLNGNSIDTEGNLSYKSGKVSITQGGSYVFSGSLTNGQIYIETNELVRIALNNVEIHNEIGAAIETVKAKKLVVTLVEGSSNLLSDGNEYTLKASEDEPNATLYSKDDLTVNGTGNLILKSNYKHGILSKDVLKIVSGNYQIEANNDAIRGRDGVLINDGTFVLNTQGDGIQSNNDTDASKGWVTINNGNFTISALGDGIQAETVLTLKNGTYNITTLPNTTDSSNKGLKAGGDVIINDGNYIVSSVDDSVHSNGNITLDKGVFELSSDDDGIHADGNLKVVDGTISILKSYEGLEGSNITIENGTISIVSSDDGINAAGGNDQTDGRSDKFMGGNHDITINGGNISIDAGGDGVDSNGNLTINDGIVLVHGPVSNGDGALDYDGEGLINGGTVIAYGSGSMSQTFGTNSKQSVLEVKIRSSIQANTKFELLNSSKEVILEFNSEKPFGSVVLSSKSLVKDETYYIRIGGVETGSTILTETVQFIDESGNAQSGGNEFGPGQFGGNRKPPRR